MNGTSNARIDKLREYMLKNEFDSMLVTDCNNMRYFSGFTGEGYLLITLNGLSLITDFRYIAQGKEQATEYEVFDIKDFELKDFSSGFFKTGFENKKISYNEYRKFADNIPNLYGVDDLFTDLRAVKTEKEIELIQKAEQIGDMAFSHILHYIKPGVRERDLALEIEFFMRKNGAEALSFDTIVACGPHGALPHAEPDERRIAKGDFIVFDFGCKYNGYCSDMTRTVSVGKADSEKKKVYDTVLKAQISSIDLLCDGVLPCDVHMNAQRIIDADYQRCFGHSLGHGVGLEIHENPTLSPKNSVPLKTGNVVTVEPGIYINGFCGVRIEDVVVISGDGIINLTKSDKNLIEI